MLDLNIALKQMQHFGADILKRRTKMLGSLQKSDAAFALVNLDKSDDGSARVSLNERRGTHGVLNSNTHAIKCGISGIS